MTASGWHRKRTTPAERQRRKDYGSKQHRAQRANDARMVASGHATCWRCGKPIPAGTPSGEWHSGHDDNDRRIYRGPEHRSCNLKAAASKGARVVNARRSSFGSRRLPTW